MSSRRGGGRRARTRRARIAPPPPRPATTVRATPASRSIPPGSRPSASTPARSSGARRPRRRRSVKKEYQAAWLVRALTCIDLTTLAGDDTPGRVRRLCAKARQPLSDDLLAALGLADAPPTVGAVCVYPTMVAPAVKALAGSGIPVASVATGFPAGLTPLPLRLAEIKYAVERGRRRDRHRHHPRPCARTANGTALYDEVRAMREACGAAHLKTILGTGDLKTLRNVYAASMVAMQAGADFIKTSTGKEDVNATLPVSLVMLRALRDYGELTGFEIGFKPAGGLRTAKDALNWLILMQRGTGPGLDAHRSLPHRRQRAAHRHRAPARTFRDRPLFRELSPRDGDRTHEARSPTSCRRWTTARRRRATSRARLARRAQRRLRPFHRRPLHASRAHCSTSSIPPTASASPASRQGGEADVDAAVAAARKALPAWSALPGDARARHLYALARHVQKRERFLAVLEIHRQRQADPRDPRHRHSAGRAAFLPSRRLGLADRRASFPATGRSASAARSSRGISRC